MNVCDQKNIYLNNVYLNIGSHVCFAELFVLVPRENQCSFYFNLLTYRSQKYCLQVPRGRIIEEVSVKKAVLANSAKAVQTDQPWIGTNNF